MSRERRRELGDVGEAFVPQHHDAGVEAEVDWGEAWAVIDGERREGPPVPACGCVTRARRSRWRSRSETQQAFLEGHVEAFECLGGVPGWFAMTT